MPINQTRPFILNQLLEQWVSNLKIILKDNLLACYLQGSFAVGDWDADSDVDFMAVIDKDLSDEAVQLLNIMHQDLFETFLPWSHHLEGTYFPKDILKQHDPNKTPLWYLDNTSKTLERSNHDNELVVRWVTREHGITLYGDNPPTYIDPVPASALKTEIIETMQEWGQEILAGDYVMKSLWEQPFVVISYCRMLQSLETGTIQSKLAGVNWAQKSLPPEWHELIVTAWENRPNPSEKAWLPAPEKAIKHTYDFIHYALDLAEINKR